MYEGRSNTDSGSKRGVQCRDSSILYLAFIIRNLFKYIKINIIKIVIADFIKSMILFCYSSEF